MAWTRPADLRGRVRGLWDRGRILSSLATRESMFPIRLALKRPSAAELRDHFDEARHWSASLRSMPHVRITMREFRHRVSGANALPHEAWIDTVEDAAAMIGKRGDVAAFRCVVETTRSRHPSLVPWLARRPLKALDLAGEWGRLLDVVGWLKDHPRPGIHLRQMDVPGVHSKFVEARRGVLGELLDCVAAARSNRCPCHRHRRLFTPVRLPRQARAHTLSGPGSCACPVSGRRSARRSRPGRDPRCRDVRGTRDRRRPVFVTENEVNFLAFPNVEDAMVVFGAGYGFESLRRARWISRCGLFYWGDIDTHGFAILDELRTHFGHAESFLMDRETFLAFASLWGTERSPTDRDLPRLTAGERALYDDLRCDRLGSNLRLEQERIGFDWVRGRLARV